MACRSEASSTISMTGRSLRRSASGPRYRTRPRKKLQTVPVAARQANLDSSHFSARGGFHVRGNQNLKALRSALSPEVQQTARRPLDYPDSSPESVGDLG